MIYLDVWPNRCPAGGLGFPSAFQRPLSPTKPPKPDHLHLANPCPSKARMGCIPISHHMFRTFSVFADGVTQTNEARYSAGRGGPSPSTEQINPFLLLKREIRSVLRFRCCLNESPEFSPRFETPRNSSSKPCHNQAELRFF